MGWRYWRDAGGFVFRTSDEEPDKAWVWKDPEGWTAAATIPDSTTATEIAQEDAENGKAD